jgi:hypothetical protein
VVIACLGFAIALTDITTRSASMLREAWVHDRGVLIFLLVLSALAYLYGVAVCQASGTGSLRLHAYSLEPGGLLDLFEGPHMLVLVQFPLPVVAALWGGQLSRLWPVGLGLSALAAMHIVRSTLAPRPRLRPYLAGFLLLIGLALVRPLPSAFAGAGLLIAFIPYEARLWQVMQQRLPSAETAGRHIHGVTATMLVAALLSVIAAFSPVAYAVVLFGPIVAYRLALVSAVLGARGPEGLDQQLGKALGESALHLAADAAAVGTHWPYRWLVARSLPESSPSP